MDPVIESKIKLLNTLSSDYKAELIAAELWKQGVAEDKLQFKNCGTFNRSVSKDIQAINLNTDDLQEIIEIEVTREGIYDMLPEAVFHYNASKKKAKDEILEEIKKTRQEEDEARKFFLPFENEFHIKRLFLELQYQNFLKFDATKSNRLLFESLYYNFGHLEDSQILYLLYIIPLTYKIRADVEKIKYCLSRLIGLPLTIEYAPPRVKKYVAAFPIGLGHALLGIDSIAGDSITSENRAYMIKISNIKSNKIHLYFLNSKIRSFIDCLLSLFLPANCDFELILEVDPQENQAFISDATAFSYLNYNSYIA